MRLFRGLASLVITGFALAVVLTTVWPTHTSAADRYGANVALQATSSTCSSPLPQPLGGPVKADGSQTMMVCGLVATLPNGIRAPEIAGTVSVSVGLLNGSAATAAERQAAERFGPEYRYRTIGLHAFTFVDDSVVFATVAMWNDRELKVLDGAWSTK